MPSSLTQRALRYQHRYALSTAQYDIFPASSPVPGRSNIILPLQLSSTPARGNNTEGIVATQPHINRELTNTTRLPYPAGNTCPTREFSSPLAWL